jgi:hypothetical protein
MRGENDAERPCPESGTVVNAARMAGTDYSPQERDELVAAVALAAGKPLRLKER